MEKPKYPSVYDYLNYREWLRDMFNYRKQMSRYYSYRYFSRQAGFSSPNFLKLVTDGKRNLTLESIGKVAKGFKLTQPEREFFQNLVLMNQASTHEQRNHYYQKMIAAKGFQQIHKLETASYEYFSKWYYPVIRELVEFKDGRLGPEDIAAMLDPPITVREAQNALDLLQRLELIRKDESGRWQKADKAVTTGPEVRSLVVGNFHREMIRLAVESMERHEPETRDITSVTISIPKSRMADIKQKTAVFRKELLEMACGETEADQVVQVNIQVFPLTS